MAGEGLDKDGPRALKRYLVAKQSGGR